MNKANKRRNIIKISSNAVKNRSQRKSILNTSAGGCNNREDNNNQ